MALRYFTTKAAAAAAKKNDIHQAAAKGAVLADAIERVVLSRPGVWLRTLGEQCAAITTVTGLGIATYEWVSGERKKRAEQAVCDKKTKADWQSGVLTALQTIGREMQRKNDALGVGKLGQVLPGPEKPKAVVPRQ